MERICSEIASLKRVIVHRPGSEVERMTPGTARELLYNDIIPLEAVQKEHDGLVNALRLFTEVLELETLLAQALQDEETRVSSVDLFAAPGTLAHDHLLTRWADSSGEAAARDLLAGVPMPTTRLKTAMNGPTFLLPPLPNVYFTRDIGFVVGDRLFVSRMAHAVRANEASAARIVFDRFDRENVVLLDCPAGETIEGGDVLVVNENLILVGIGERTSAGAVDTFVHSLLKNREHVGVTVLAVQLPRHRATIHLDMIATLVDDGALLGYEPYLIGARACPVFRVDASRGARWVVREEKNLIEALANCDYPVDLVACGGRNAERQEREQWFSACNSVAVAPGRIVVYETNYGTLDELDRAGFSIVKGSSGSWDVPSTGRAAVAIPGVELARGGGGPRCMTLPIFREANNE